MFTKSSNLNKPANFTAKRAGVDQLGHEIAEGEDVQGVWYWEDGKKQPVTLACQNCVASEYKFKTVEEMNGGKTAPKQPNNRKNSNKPAPMGVITFETLSDYGQRLIDSFNAKLADEIAKLPKSLTMGEIQSNLVSNGSIAEVVKTVIRQQSEKPNVCGAITSNGKQCINPAKHGAFCGRHKQDINLDRQPEEQQSEQPEQATLNVDSLPVF
jgi:hypothetical protein